MLRLLDGKRVVEMGHILLAPYATQMLGDFGADVVKVESLDGDTYRGLGQPRSPGGMTAQWMANNRNKRSIALNLKDPEARDALMKLVGCADAFVHNMRPAAVERLGFGYEALSKLNPKLVYAQAVGFGSSGPYAGRPAVDDVIQGWSGFADLMGLHGEGPEMAPVAVCDVITALILGQTVLAGMLKAAETGKGCFLETAMFEAMATVGLNQHLNGHTFHPPNAGLIYARTGSPHRRPVATKDGWVIHAVYNFMHWTKFLKAVGREDVLNGPMMVDRYAAAANVGELYRLLAEEILPTRTTAEWLALFGELDIPAAPCTELEALETDPHLAQVGLFRDYEHPSQGLCRETRAPVESRDVEEAPDRHPPELGEHTEEILREAGVSAEEIASMFSRGVLKGFAPEPA
ncbi:CoA transferase [Albimonas sp. CAU 1670]|uniref:CaiB/BaiF CoA transferase family protein n=1 Tax=Albimonas sp. CAU 1670 TaxID=3032599 RepID=UPI0023DCC57A|nr:CoA transferase [Albimonas sp. CAU 1670]MDF2233573.1 CoA transferase [Albimonas sp. CAU 1670]